MKVKLTVSERITLMGVLPQEGNFATLKVVQDLRNNVGLTQKELGLIDYKQVGDRAEWDPDKEDKAIKEIDFGKYELDVIKSALEKLDKEEKMSIHQVSLYEKFMK